MSEKIRNKGEYIKMPKENEPKINPENTEIEAVVDCPAPPCLKLFSVGDIVQHKASGQIGIISRVHTGPCVNPTHGNIFACCTPTFESLEQVYAAAQNPCQREPIDLYDVSIGFGEDIRNVGGFLLVDKTEPNERT